MNVNVFLKIKGLVCVVFGLLMLVVPGVLAPIYGFVIDFSSLYFTHFFGVCFLGLGLICWSTSLAPVSELKQNILLSLAVIDTIGTGFCIYHQLVSPLNAIHWSTVVLWALFAAGCWIYRSTVKE